MRLPHPRLPTHRPHIPFFRIFYSSTFTALLLLLGAALLITPGDQIYQSFRAQEIFHIFIIAGFYVLTAIIALLIYGGRMYKTRSALAGIPRDWRGTEGKGVGMNLGRVGRVIQDGLENSAWIAFEARPRDLTAERSERGVGRKHRFGMQAMGQQERERMQPTWGTLSHPGWSSPSSPDLPNLHYEPVILELPHLIEAKAVSLAPPDLLCPPELTADPSDPPLPDPLAVELLQRPASMGLRDYIAHLTTLNMITPPELGPDFLTIYEQARFSGKELNEIEFRGLMSVFAEILRNMAPLAPNIVETLHTEMEEEETSSQDSPDRRSLATNETVEHTHIPEEWVSARPDVWTSSSSASSAGARSEDGTIHIAPSRPAAERDDSAFSKVTRASQRRGAHTPSIRSLRRMRSGTTSSVYSGKSAAGSVIRLAEARAPLDLPYEYVSADERG